MIKLKNEMEVSSYEMEYEETDGIFWKQIWCSISVLSAWRNIGGRSGGVRNHYKKGKRIKKKKVCSFENKKGCKKGEV